MEVRRGKARAGRRGREVGAVHDDLACPGIEAGDRGVLRGAQKDLRASRHRSFVDGGEGEPEAEADGETDRDAEEEPAGGLSGDLQNLQGSAGLTEAEATSFCREAQSRKRSTPAITTAD